MEPAPKVTVRQARVDAYEERVLETFQLDPRVALTLKGKALTLEFNNRAIKGVLKDCGFNALKSSLTVEAMEDPNTLGSLLFRGLQTHHPEMTQDDVDLLFTSRHYPYILNRIRAAMEMFLPDLSDLPVTEEDAQDPPQPRQPTPRG